MVLSLVLFVHITGVLALFAGLALEGFGVESARKAAPRLSLAAMALTVVSGFYLGGSFGVLGEGWLRVSYGAIVLMAVVGGLARRADALVQFSLTARTALGVAIVFLMTATPRATASLIVVGIALVGSMIVSLPRRPRRARGEHVREVSHKDGHRLVEDAPSS